MLKKASIAALVLGAATIGASAQSDPGPVPTGIPHMDHIWVIMMENHGFNQVLNNPQMPWFNAYGRSVNAGTNYYAVGHPSLTNYLEVVRGSNFGVRDDNSPDWHNSSCQTNLATGVPNLESSSNAVCPIAGTGTDAATPALDCTNETSGPPCVVDVDGNLGYNAQFTVGETIADQLAAANLSWKSYQEDLPPTGPDSVNTADGYFTNNSNLGTALPGETTSLVGLYAVKHDPFAYFANLQNGSDSNVSYAQISDWGGPKGLFADIVNGRLPNFAWIVPNQCHDQHGRGNAGPECEYDPNDNGTQNGLNPGLMYDGDQSMRLVVEALHASPQWREGNNAIVIIWDEDDYSVSPTVNKVAVTVELNHGPHGIVSNNFYTHFSLLRSMEARFGLQCLNHACDSSTAVMTDLFGGATPTVKK